MSRTLTIRNCQRARSIDMRLLRQIINVLLTDLLQIEPADLGFYFIGTPEMTRLNETFVHHAGSTDVITFDYSNNVAHASRLLGKFGTGNEKMPKPGDSVALHGEIFVCVDKAIVQARRFRTHWQSELARYAIHGMLHLLGFDDQTTARRREMKRAENWLLRELGRRFRLTNLALSNRNRRAFCKS